MTEGGIPNSVCWIPKSIITDTESQEYKKIVGYGCRDSNSSLDLGRVVSYRWTTAVCQYGIGISFITFSYEPEIFMNDTGLDYQMKVLFVRPPRYMWPWNSESSSFWQPLGFASMASILRENGVQVEILDCLPRHMGWKTLKKTILNKNTDVLCVGDETASADESIKLTRFVKEHNPKVITVAGGYFFSYIQKPEWMIDYVVKGEGEQTLLELLSFLSGKEAPNYCPPFKPNKIGSVQDIRGLIVKGKDTGEREPVDLDRIPLPAYDLLPMHLYGKYSKNHKDFAAIEHGRGCTGGCSFCSINALYSNGGKSCYRTKSAERSLEETKILVEQYGRKTLNWADGTFNLDPEWSKRYFELLEEEGIKVKHTAWMHADCIVRDEKEGIMQSMVKNGLIQAIVGMERLDDSYGKKHKTCMEAFGILKKYPTVYTIATLIYGLPEDSKKELREIKRFIYKDIVDFQFILPFTPYPGTEEWEKNENELLDFKFWNLHKPVMGTKFLTREQLDWWFKVCLLSYLFHPNFYVRNFLQKDPRRRKVGRSLSGKLMKGIYRGVRDVLTGEKTLKYGKKPRWYDS